MVLEDREVVLTIEELDMAESVEKSVRLPGKSFNRSALEFPTTVVVWSTWSVYGQLETVCYCSLSNIILGGQTQLWS